MAYVGNTPEQFLSRSDSKNPQTTCRGLTSNGRPCRRALASSAANTTPTKHSHSRDLSQSSFLTSSASSSPQSIQFPSRIHNGVFAVAQDNDDADVINAAFFCWQHKDQAASVLHVAQKEVVEVQGRSSIDTLVERFGVLEVKGEKDGIIRMANRRSRNREKRNIRQQTRHQEDGNSMATVKEEKYERIEESRQKRPSLWSLLCCFSPSTMDYDDDANAMRSRHSQNDLRHHDAYHRRPEMTMTPHTPASIARPQPTATHHSRTPQDQFSSTTSSAPLLSPPISPTYDYSNPLSLIPSHLPPATQTALLNELTKPLSPKDEPGYIYIFRLNPSADSPSSPSLPTPTKDSGTLLVKIGRTNNVHRRLTSWSKQCGYTLSLLRFYPYTRTSKSPSSSPTHLHANHDNVPFSPASQPQTLPYTHRIERLIHLELSASRVKQAQCGKCGREHKEWFEVEASREGVRGVDEVVRRWVGWGEWMGKVNGGI